MKKRLVALLLCSLVLNLVFIIRLLSSEQIKPNPEVTYYNTLDYLKGARDSYSLSLEAKNADKTEILLVSYITLGKALRELEEGWYNQN